MVVVDGESPNELRFWLDWTSGLKRYPKPRDDERLDPESRVEWWVSAGPWDDRETIDEVKDWEPSGVWFKDDEVRTGSGYQTKSAIQQGSGVFLRLRGRLFCDRRNGKPRNPTFYMGWFKMNGVELVHPMWAEDE